MRPTKRLLTILQYCTHCQKHGKSPGRFKFTLKEDANFSYSILVDIMYIDGSPILHVVDEATRLQAAGWLNNVSAKNTWETLRLCWIDVYIGSPDFITHDAGSNFVSKEFRQYATSMAIATICQLEAAFDLSFAAQIVNPKEKDAKALNKRIQWQINNPTRGLHFVQLDLTSLKFVIFTDASFANNYDLSSQVGFVITLVDSDNKANIIHWSSIKCKRITRSVLASELYAKVHGFDVGAVLKSTMECVLAQSVPMIFCTDSKSLYDCLVKLGTTQEKRLMVDIMCLRQSYERREIMEIR